MQFLRYQGPKGSFRAIQASLGPAVTSPDTSLIFLSIFFPNTIPIGDQNDTLRSSKNDTKLPWDLPNTDRDSPSPPRGPEWGLQEVRGAKI